ncbi:MAG: hypothetical protein ACPG19_06850 [Saprospiraceae bacterium]
MKILQKAIPIIMLCFLMLPISILGQEENTRLIKTKKFKQLELKRAVAQAKKLSEGVLIIRLTSNNRKIKALENLVRDHPDSNRHRKLLKKTKQKTLDMQKATITAYSNFYAFSDVHFIMDLDMKKILNGTKKGIFYNEYLEKDTTIDITGKDFFFSYIGNPSAGTNTRSLLITDSKNQLVPKPFPFSILFANALDKVLFKPDSKIIIDAVLRQQEALRNFYVKARGKLGKQEGLLEREELKETKQ